MNCDTYRTVATTSDTYLTFRYDFRYCPTVSTYRCWATSTSRRNAPREGGTQGNRHARDAWAPSRLYSARFRVLLSQGEREFNKPQDLLEGRMQRLCSRPLGGGCTLVCMPSTDSVQRGCSARGMAFCSSLHGFMLCAREA